GRVPYEVLVQGEAPRERLLERFRQDVDSVLIATSTFWQGVDVPGESLSLLVIDKLPFSAPGDPLHEARCEAVEAAGGDWFRDFALPTAMLQLRQGFGRLIRGHADRGVVAILDPRLRTRAYGRAFLAALPRCPLVEDRAAHGEEIAHTPASPPPAGPQAALGAEAGCARRRGPEPHAPVRRRRGRPARADRGDPPDHARRRRHEQCERRVDAEERGLPVQ